MYNICCDISQWIVHGQVGKTVVCVLHHVEVEFAYHGDWLNKKQNMVGLNVLGRLNNNMNVMKSHVQVLIIDSEISKYILMILNFYNAVVITIYVISDI